MSASTDRSIRSSAAAPLDIAALNAEFSALAFDRRIARLYELFREDEVLYTSSFGTKSVVLLHLIARFRPTQPVYFLNTTYHFPETLAYRDQLAETFGLNVRDILPDPERNRLTRETEMWASQPGRCCHYNKVLPLKPFRATHRIWISGVMQWQTANRASLDIFDPQDDGIIKFHPLIDISEGDYRYYRDRHKLSPHPLEAHGFGSIGCTHCTVRGDGRNGRWGGEKDECGLHL